MPVLNVISSLSTEGTVHFVGTGEQFLWISFCGYRPGFCYSYKVRQVASLSWTLFLAIYVEQKTGENPLSDSFKQIWTSLLDTFSIRAFSTEWIKLPLSTTIFMTLSMHMDLLSSSQLSPILISNSTWATHGYRASSRQAESGPCANQEQCPHVLAPTPVTMHPSGGPSPWVRREQCICDPFVSFVLRLPPTTPTAVAFVISVPVP